MQTFVLLTIFMLSPVASGIRQLLALEIKCQDTTNTDYCVEVGYNRNILPPHAPLNVTMNLAISVSTFGKSKHMTLEFSKYYVGSEWRG